MKTVLFTCPSMPNFPKDKYEQLVSAYENAVPDDIEIATKNLDMTIEKMAKGYT